MLGFQKQKFVQVNLCFLQLENESAVHYGIAQALFVFGGGAEQISKQKACLIDF